MPSLAAYGTVKRRELIVAVSTAREESLQPILRANVGQGLEYV